MQKKIKLLISGKRGAGKSYFVKSISSNIECEGLITKKNKRGVTIAYMQNFIIKSYKYCAFFKKNGIVPRPHIFDEFGCGILKKLFISKKLIIIDEIGFIELNSSEYCEKLLSLLKLKKNIICVLRDERNTLIDTIKNIEEFKFKYIV